MLKMRFQLIGKYGMIYLISTSVSALWVWGMWSHLDSTYLNTLYKKGKWGWNPCLVMFYSLSNFLKNMFINSMTNWTIILNHIYIVTTIVVTDHNFNVLQTQTSNCQFMFLSLEILFPLPLSLWLLTIYSYNTWMGHVYGIVWASKQTL